MKMERIVKIVAEIATIGTVIIITMAACRCTDEMEDKEELSTSFGSDTIFGMIDSSAYIQISDLKADKLVITLSKGDDCAEYYIDNRYESVRILPVFGTGDYEIVIYEDSSDNRIIAEYSFSSYKYDCWSMTKYLDNGINIVYSGIENKLSDVYKSCHKEELLDTFDYINGYFHEFEYDYDLASKIIDGSMRRHYVYVSDLIENQKGICVDLASAMVATLRNHGHVARVVEGVLDNKDWHAWVEVRIGSEWRMYDPTLGISWKDGMNSRYIGVNYY